MLRRRDRDSHAGPPGAGRRPALALLQHHALQPVARVAPDGPAPSSDRDRHPHERRPPGGLPWLAQRAMRHARRGAASRRLRDVPQWEVAPRLVHVDAVRRLADAPGLRTILRHAGGLRELLPPDHAHARRSERRARGGRARLLLHRRDHQRSRGVRPHARRARADASVLSLRRVHDAALAAACAGRGHRAVPDDVRRRLGRIARGAASPADRRRPHAGGNDLERPGAMSPTRRGS